MSKWMLINKGDYKQVIKKGWVRDTTVINAVYKLKNDRLENKNSESFYDLFEIKKRYVDKCIKFLQSPNRFNKQYLDIAKVDLDRKKSMLSEGIEFDELYGWLCMEIGHLSLKKVSVLEFDMIVDNAIKMANKRAKNNG